MFSMYKTFFSLFALIILVSCSNQDEGNAYPESKKIDFIENIHGYEISDSYRWLEDSKVFESISASWEKTDEHGSRLFMFTLIFALLIFVSILIINSIVPMGYTQAVINSFIEYAMTIPLGYIYFTLYKSIKTN